MNRPPPGTMVYWRFKGSMPYRFGYCTYLSGQMLRMGNWNGDTAGGTICEAGDIEWKDYRP